jgi:hypothetical protein
MSTTVRRRVAALAVLATLVAMVVVMLPGAAAAAPVEPTISLADLQTKLDAAPGNVVAGYFKTVLKGSTIDTIPVAIVGITTVGNPDFGGLPPRLVMFEATGTVIDRIGGIAAGMSGSPIFVDDGGVDKLVGAVSYGDIFTLHNTGLATPVEYMTAMESVYPPKTTVMTLEQPVQLQGRTVARALVAPTTGAARTTFHTEDTAVFSPLTTFELGGIPASSPLFKAMRSRFASRGVELVAGTMGEAYDPSFETTLTGGAAVAAMAVRGDMWFGAAGTVTYATTDTVVAFGHPLFWSGPTGLALTNAWVDGIWPSTYEPYKLISPTKLRGTLTQDRSAGVSGRLDVLPQETTVTSRARMPEDGVDVHSTSYLPRWVADSADWMYLGLPAEPALVAPYRAEDAMSVPGSAVTTATIVVSDGTHTYTYKRTDLIDTSGDIGSEAGYSLFDAVYNLQSLNGPDIKKAHILSVDLDTTMTRTRRGATVVDVTVPGGLVTGTNTAYVTLRLHDGTRRTIARTVTVPKGSSTQGYIMVGPSAMLGNGMNYDTYMYYDPYYYSYTEPGESDTTLAEVVQQLQSTPKNTDLMVYYQPYGYTQSASRPITATVATDSFLRGVVSKSTSTITLYRTSPTTVPYGGSLRLRGAIYQLNEDATLTLMRRLAGSSHDTTVTQIKASVGTGWYPTFDYTVKGQWCNATYTLRWDGNSRMLGTRASVASQVGAKVGASASPSRTRLGSTVRLNATVAPAQPSGKVVFEVLTSGTWKAIKTVGLTSGKTAGFAWRPPSRGTYKVRARFLGSTLNAGAASGAVSVVIY